MEGDTANKPKSQKSVSEEIKAKRLVRRNYLAAVYLFVVSFLCLSWFIGVMGGSFLWIFLLCVGLYTIWTTRITTLVRQYMQQEDIILQRKRTLKRCESVEWLNFVINRWWVYSSGSIENLVKKRLNNRLLKVKPHFVESISLVEFDLGEQTPFVKNITMMEYDECQPGQNLVNWSDVTSPPKGLCAMSHYNLVVDAEIGLNCDDFSMVLRSHVGSKKVGVNVDMAVENVNIAGKLQVILQMSMDVPFPHFSRATVYFTQTPDVWFNVRCLHSLQLMELPLIRTWIHTHVMEGLSDALVDPGKITVTLGKPGPKNMAHLGRLTSQTKPTIAMGVVTVSVTCTPSSKIGSDDLTYMTLRVGQDKVGSRDVLGQGEWKDCASFLVYNLGLDKLTTKYKLKRLLSSTTILSKDLPLSQFPFPLDSKAEKVLESSDGSILTLSLEYTTLPEVDVSITAEVSRDSSPTDKRAGVMYIKVHGASGLIAGDRGDTSDPYCVVYCDRKKILTTPYIARTKSPSWESDVDFFVSDFSQKTYSFFVYDWDGVSTADDDFLGSAFFTMTADQPKIIRKVLTLGYNNPSEGYIENRNYGVVSVSAVFRPVNSVTASERYRELYDAEYPVRPLTVESPIEKVSNARSREDDAAAFKERLLETKMFVELGIVSARNLVAGDRSGSSDPYAEVLISDKTLYKTSVKKKTLNPVWDETATFYLTDKDKYVDIVVYDKDFLGKDFLGSIQLTVDELKALAIEQTTRWYKLQKTKHGEIQLKCSVMSKDTDEIKHKTSTISVIYESDINANEKTTRVAPPVIPPRKSVSTNVNGTGDHRGNHYRSNESFTEITMPVNQNIYKQAVNDMSVHARDEDKPVLRQRNRPRSNEGRDPLSHRSVSEMNLSNASQSRRFFPSLSRPRAFSAKGTTDRDSGVSTATLDSANTYYGVKGTIIQARGLSVPDSDVYCRVRLDRIKHGHSMLKTLAKSDAVHTNILTTFNIMFDVDRGHGVPKDALLIIDFKSGRKETISSRSFTLHELIGEAQPSEKVQKWVKYDVNVEIEIAIAYNDLHPDKQLKHHTGIFKSFSFARKSHGDLRNT